MTGKEVSVLVNNVGGGFGYTGSIHEATADQYFKGMNLNCTSQFVMTKYFVPKIYERAKAKKVRGGIISLSSVMKEMLTARALMYCTAKSFNYAFSETLRQEYGDHLDILTTLPRSVRSNMNPGIWAFSVTSEQHAKACLDQLGWETETYGHLMHDMQGGYRSYFPWIAGPTINWYNSRARKNLPNMTKEAEAKAGVDKNAKTNNE